MYKLRENCARTLDVKIPRSSAYHNSHRPFFFLLSDLVTQTKPARMSDGSHRQRACERNDLRASHRETGLLIHGRVTKLVSIIAILFMQTLLAVGGPQPYIPPLEGSSQCIIDCAQRYPGLGDDYVACVAACREGNLRIRHSGPLGANVEPGSGQGAADIEQMYEASANHPLGTPLLRALLVQEAIAWAEDIQQMREASADPLDILLSLRGFFENQWPDDRIRTRLVDPFFVATVREMALLENQAHEEADLLHDMVLDIARNEHLMSRVPQMTRASVLALASWLALPDELDEFEEAIEHYLVADEVDAIVHVFEAHATPSGY